MKQAENEKSHNYIYNSSRTGMISGLDHGNRNDIYPSWTESVITYIIHDRKNKEEQRNLNWVTYWAKQIERLFRDQFFSQFFDCVITYIIIWNLSRMTNGYESRGESQSAWLVNTPPKVLRREVGHRRVTTWLRSLKPSTLSYLVGYQRVTY